MNTKIETININSIPKFPKNEIKMPQSQERIYRMHKYLLGMNRHIDLNISAFDTDQNLTNAESINSSSKENLNKSSIPPNHRFSGFRNSMFDISIINSPSTNKSNVKGILPPIKYNFFADEETLKYELEQAKKRKSMMNGKLNCQLKDLDNQFAINLSSFKKPCSFNSEKMNNSNYDKKENSNFSLDKKEISNLINDLDNSKMKRCSQFSNFTAIEGKVNEEDDEGNDSDFSDFDSDC